MKKPFIKVYDAKNCCYCLPKWLNCPRDLLLGVFKSPVQALNLKKELKTLENFEERRKTKIVIGRLNTGDKFQLRHKKDNISTDCPDAILEALSEDCYRSL